MSSFSSWSFNLALQSLYSMFGVADSVLHTQKPVSQVVLKNFVAVHVGLNVIVPWIRYGQVNKPFIVLGYDILHLFFLFFQF